MLAMTLHPKWQLRAQQEIDAHLGGSRLPEVGDQDELPEVGDQDELPEVGDQDELPFLDCILQESFR